METKESVKVLQECIELQSKKSQDYQNPNSNVLQSMHYRRGVDTIHDIMHGKMLRAQSLIEAQSETPNFESLEDTYKDLINYASFAVSYIRGKMEGQDPDRDMFNKQTQSHTITAPKLAGLEPAPPPTFNEMYGTALRRQREQAALEEASGGHGWDPGHVGQRASQPALNPDDRSVPVPDPDDRFGYYDN